MLGECDSDTSLEILLADGESLKLEEIVLDRDASLDRLFDVDVDACQEKEPRVCVGEIVCELVSHRPVSTEYALPEDH